MCKPVVLIAGSAYQVRIDGDPIVHLVKKTRQCSCGIPECNAVLAVEDYLRAGGRRAPDPLPPCPICGKAVVPDSALDGKYTHEPGWRCMEGGIHHFYLDKQKKVAANFAKHPKLDLITFAEAQAISEEVFRKTGYDPTA